MHRARLEAGGGADAGCTADAARPAGNVCRADRGAQQLHELQIQRCDEQADVGRKAHPRHNAKSGERLEDFWGRYAEIVAE